MDFQTLFIRFKVDATGAKQGVKQATKTTEEFKKSLKDANTNTDKLTESFTSLAKSVAGFLTVALSTNALFKGLEGAASYTTALAYQSDQLGLNIGDLQAYDQALEHTGGKQGEYATNLKALMKSMGAPASLIQSDVIPMLADAFPKFNQQQRNVVADYYGITPAFVQLLVKGSAELDKLVKHQKELGLPTIEEGKIFKELNDHVLDASNSLRYTFEQAMVQIAPTIERFLDIFIKGLQTLRENPDATKAALMTIAAGFTALGAALVIANIEFVGIAASIAIIIAGIEKLVPLIKEFAAFEDSRKAAIGSIDESWRGAIFGGKSNDVENNKPWINGITNPLNNQTSASINNNSNQTTMNNDNSFKMSNVTVVTQAQDASKMVNDLLGRRFRSEWSKANYTFVSGEKI